MSRHKSAAAGTIIILGMHRSGTSCLAGSLQEAGLYLGNVNEDAPHNAKGNRENRAIMDLHDEVLAANGGSWNSPPNSVDWKYEHEVRRNALIDGYPEDRIWGFKDPRTLFTLEGWLKALPATQCVGTFRHPLAVAQSLQRRNGFSREQSLALWVTCNRQMLRHQDNLGFDLINFDWPADRYHTKLVEIALRLNLKSPPKGFSFFEAGLRSADAMVEGSVPGPVADIYGILQEIAA